MTEVDGVCNFTIGDMFTIDQSNADEFRSIIGDPLADALKGVDPLNQSAYGARMNYVVKVFKYLDSSYTDSMEAPYLIEQPGFRTEEQARAAAKEIFGREEVGGYVIENAYGFPICSEAKMKE